MADKYYFCASAGKDVVITKNVIKTGGTVSMGILGKIATSACSNRTWRPLCFRPCAGSSARRWRR